MKNINSSKSNYLLGTLLFFTMIFFTFAFWPISLEPLATPVDLDIEFDGSSFQEILGSGATVLKVDFSDQELTIEYTISSLDQNDYLERAWQLTVHGLKSHELVSKVIIKAYWGQELAAVAETPRSLYKNIDKLSTTEGHWFLRDSLIVFNPFLY